MVLSTVLLHDAVMLDITVMLHSKLMPNVAVILDIAVVLYIVYTVSKILSIFSKTQLSACFYYLFWFILTVKQFSTPYFLLCFEVSL